MTREPLYSALVAVGLVAAGSAQATPVVHTLTLTAERLSDSPFGLTSLPGALSFEFVVDDSILVSGTSSVIDSLPGFSLLEPIVIGDATFTNTAIAVVPGGRVTDGVLVEIYLLAQIVDPVEGQRQITTYFFPEFQWDGADFDLPSPSEFIFGTYRVTLGPKSVPEPGTLAVLGMGLAGLVCTRRKKTAVCEVPGPLVTRS